MRRPIVSVIGDAGARPGDAAYDLALEIGERAIGAGFRVMSGGLGGVMEAVSKGAHASERYQSGDTIGVLPGYDPAVANPWVDIAIATGLDHGRNTLVANADAIIAVGGGAGTLSEIAFAWMLKRLIVAAGNTGWAERLGGAPLDQRRRVSVDDDQVYAAAGAREAIALVVAKLPLYTARQTGFR